MKDTHMISLICGVQKKDTKWTCVQNRFTDIENKFMFWGLRKGKVRGGGGINQEFGINNTHITICKIDSQQKPTG